MNPALVVVRPFAAYGPGAVITDPKEVARVLADERAANVARVTLPGVPAMAAAPAAPPAAATPPAVPPPPVSLPAASPPATPAPATQTTDNPVKEG